MMEDKKSQRKYIPQRTRQKIATLSKEIYLLFEFIDAEEKRQYRTMSDKRLDSLQQQQIKLENSLEEITNRYSKEMVATIQDEYFSRLNSEGDYGRDTDEDQ